MLGHLENIQIKLGGVKINNLLNTIFTFYSPEYLLKKELASAISDYKTIIGSSFPKKLLKKIKQIDDIDYSCCLKNIDYILSKDNIKTDKHEGEKRCLASSLYLNRFYQKQIYLLSDDRRAREHFLNYYINSQKIGDCISFPDLFLSFYTRRKSITASEVLIAIQQYYGYLPAKKAMAKEKQTEYNRWLINACRAIDIRGVNCNIICNIPT
jgi:hypothetical protein